MRAIRPFSFASPVFTGFAFFVGVSLKPAIKLSHIYYIVNSYYVQYLLIMSHKSKKTHSYLKKHAQTGIFVLYYPLF